MRIEDIYRMISEVEQDLILSEEFSFEAKNIIHQAVITYANCINILDDDLAENYLQDRKNFILEGVTSESFRFRGVEMLWNKIEEYLEFEVICVGGMK